MSINEFEFEYYLENNLLLDIVSKLEVILL